jgi:Flp pilus assembly protein TadD
VFALWVSIALAVAAAYVESGARSGGTMRDVSAGTRLTLALTAPFRYLWRTIAPFGLTPVDPLALAPRANASEIVAAGAALAAISWAAWRWRRQRPSIAIAWLSYLLLLLPAAGFLPSGLQATADRYSYLPSIPLSIAIATAAGAILARAPRSLVQPLRIAAAIVIAALAWMSYRQTRDWRDSLTLWTRAVELNPENDIALYNLASALADRGRRDEALARYEEVLKLVPGQADALKNRNLLLAARIEDDGNRLAASGDLGSAIGAYRRAIGLDPARTHAQAALGIALVQSGHTDEALAPLREAVKLGSSEPAVPNALAFVLMNEGRTREACDVLEAARARFPDDANVARNLAQLECGNP